jgi:hypothetical protein
MKSFAETRPHAAERPNLCGNGTSFVAPRLPLPSSMSRPQSRRCDVKPSGREVQMGDEESFEARDGAGLGLSEAELQAMARRQLTASIAVAVVIALGVALAALTPASRDHGQIAAHRTVLVQQPTMTIPPDHRIASRTRPEVELP